MTIRGFTYLLTVLYFSYTVQNLNKDVSSQSDPSEGLNHCLGKLKEEVKGQDGISVKHEVRPCPVSPIIQKLC